jgi:BirA family biotin operon repressor/biotin-[acetyl-CoA-carboxylase] ligase
MPDAAPFRLDGVDAATLAARLAVPDVVLLDSVASTMDVAHAAAANGAPGGTLVVADRQTAGRGRTGRRWSAAPGAGLWATFIERPTDPAALDVLSLRLGLALAAVLDRWLGAPARLKWPNDVHGADGKVAGVLVEARWQDEHPAWVAIGIGVNLRVPPDVAGAASLGSGASRLALLDALVPRVRAAALAHGTLSAGEMRDFAARDLARGRPCREPAVGTVVGIAASGELLVRSGDAVGAYRSGSLVLVTPPPAAGVRGVAVEERAS